ncbi:long-chain-fatty-acid--CoA ligase [Aeromicrobium piscarium]|nr:long-chain fatty acid--CoA ligase [Aeromicrobium piscarium]
MNVTSIPDALWTGAAMTPEQPAVRGVTRAQTYRELRDAAGVFTSGLRERGVGRGDRIVLIAPTVPEFAQAYVGALAGGVVVVPVNTMATAHEIGYIVRDSGATLLLAWHGCDTSARTAGEWSDLPGWTFDETTVDGARDASGLPPEAMTGDETAVLLYTSGTTGKPKGVRLTGDNLLTAAQIVVERVEITRDDRLGTALPLFHVFGQAVCLNAALVAGAPISLLSPFTGEAMLDLIRRDRLTVVSGVPTMWNAMLHAGGEYGPEDFRELRVATSGGAALPAEVLRAFAEKFGCTILEGYGLTETTALATFNQLDREQRAGTVGVPMPGIEVRVCDERDVDLPVGEVGELLVRGFSVMAGYWNRPEADAKDLAGGWFHTGDLGRLDEDGYLTIVDRVKDLIIRGGYNVYPREVEEVLYEHPDVVEVAVIGIPDDRYGEEVAAVIALRPGSDLDTTELRLWAKERLSAYKVPHEVRFVDSLPKGGTGKIQKRALDWSTLATNVRR